MKRVLFMEGDGQAVVRRAKRYDATVAVHLPHPDPNHSDQARDGAGVRLAVHPDGGWEVTTLTAWPEAGSREGTVVASGYLADLADVPRETPPEPAYTVVTGYGPTIYHAGSPEAALLAAAREEFTVREATPQELELYGNHLAAAPVPRETPRPAFAAMGTDAQLDHLRGDHGNAAAVLEMERLRAHRVGHAVGGRAGHDHEGDEGDGA